jgi:uncharacterized protein (TIGR02145 family)
MKRLYIPNSTTIYSPLYNWWVGVDVRNIAPIGYHMPSDAEWQGLGLAYGASLNNCTKPLKSVGNSTDGTGLWKKHTDTSVEGTNTSGFTINPGGVISETGISSGRNSYANYWTIDEQTSTKGKYRNIGYNGTSLYQYTNYYDKRRGFNIRLVRDTVVGWNPGDLMTDASGNTYTTALMLDGNVWMTQDLKTKHYRDGTPIPIIINPTEWSALSTGALNLYTL